MKITRFWFENRNKALHLAVQPYKNDCRCPECGRRGRIMHQASEFRRWEDLGSAPKEIQRPDTRADASLVHRRYDVQANVA